MQDPSAFPPMRPPPFPEQERLKCPRCDSSNTKFCYYNNYNLSQPRHFCKHCRRYWTKGGSLRNIPVGGGTRKNAAKRAAASSAADTNPKRPELGAEPESQGQGSGHDSLNSPPPPPPPPQAAAAAPSPSTSGVEPTRSYFPNLSGGSFSSLLASNMQFGGIFEGLNSSGSGTSKMVQLGEFENINSDTNMDSRPEQNNGGPEQENYLSLQNGGENSSCWGNGGTNWPDLAIYTPSSRFQ